jgi:hypothetical protein
MELSLTRSHACICISAQDAHGNNSAGSFVKLVHEQLAMQWSICNGPGRETALSAGWFFFELMVKAMVEHLATTARLGANRKTRFSEQFHEDVANLVSSVTVDIVCKHKSNPEVRTSINILYSQLV